MKKRICFVLDLFLFGGIEKVAINYLNTIDRKRYDVDVFILSDYEDIIKQIPNYCNVYNIRIHRSHNPLYRANLMNIISGGALIYYPTFLLKKIFLFPIDYLHFLKFRKKNYDVAIAFSGHLNDGYVVSKLLKANKKIIWTHGMLYQYIAISPAYEKMYKDFDYIVSINNINQTDLFECKPRMNHNVVNIYNPVCLSKSNGEDINKKYGKYILSVARLCEPKDFVTLINAYDKMSKNLTNKYKLLIVGDGPDREKITKIIKQKQLTERVILVGTKENVGDYYKGAELFVLSSKSEGLPTVIIEAMGNGCPVISTDAPYGPRDIIQNNRYGIVTQVSNSEELASKMEELLLNKDLKEHYKKMGLERFKDFECQKIIEKFYELIEK